MQSYQPVHPTIIRSMQFLQANGQRPWAWAVYYRSVSEPVANNATSSINPHFDNSGNDGMRQTINGEISMAYTLAHGLSPAIYKGKAWWTERQGREQAQALKTKLYAEQAAIVRAECNHVDPCGDWYEININGERVECRDLYNRPVKRTVGVQITDKPMAGARLGLGGTHCQDRQTFTTADVEAFITAKIKATGPKTANLSRKAIAAARKAQRHIVRWYETPERQSRSQAA